jgi:hypothetical protein
LWWWVAAAAVELPLGSQRWWGHLDVVFGRALARARPFIFLERAATKACLSSSRERRELFCVLHSQSFERVLPLAHVPPSSPPRMTHGTAGPDPSFQMKTYSRSTRPLTDYCHRPPPIWREPRPTSGPWWSRAAHPWRKRRVWWPRAARRGAARRRCEEEVRRAEAAERTVAEAERERSNVMPASRAVVEERSQLASRVGE